MMSLMSIGELARGLTLQSRSAQIKSEIDTLSKELASGQVADISARLGGDYSHLLDLDHSLSRLNAFSIATAETRIFTDGMQVSLTTFGDSVSEVSASLLAFGTANQTVTHQQASVQAQNELDSMISALNTRIGGRSLFSGTATDVSPLASADSLLAALRAELTGLTTLTDIRQAAEDWFNDPAGFDAVIYQGSANELSPMQISENEKVSLPFKANDTAFKNALRDVSLAALASDPALSTTPELRTALFRDLGVKLAGSVDDIVKQRAEVGAAEARIDQADTRNSAARTSAEIARNQLISADPYETATRLQTVQFPLEIL